MVELAAIVRRYGPAYRAKFHDRLLPSHLAALEASARCRTEALEGHVAQCTDCGAREYSSHAWKNRHGPQCQNDAATPWGETQRALLLPVPDLLVTCTLPEALRPVARAHQTLLDNRLLQTSAAALKALALDPTSLGGQRGLVGMLHPWTREMAYHPPIHSLVPGGALSPADAPWLPPRYADWLVPVHARSTLCRGKFPAALTTTGLLAHVPSQVWTKGWMTPCQGAGTGAEVLSYCAPSLYRVAITNARLAQCEDGQVPCRVKERTSHAWTHRTRPVEECIRRFLQHVVPQGCTTVRSYGVLSPSRRPALAQSRTLLAASPSSDQALHGHHPQDRHEPPRAPQAALHCRSCGGPLVFLSRLVPQKSRPP